LTNPHQFEGKGKIIDGKIMGRKATENSKSGQKSTIQANGFGRNGVDSARSKRAKLKSVSPIASGVAIISILADAGCQF